MGTEAAAARRRPVTRVAALVVVVLGGAIAYSALHHRIDGPSGGAGGPSTPVAAGHHAAPPPALRLVAMAPTAGAKGVGFSAPITLRFSHALKPDSAVPELIPALSGEWSRPSPSVLRFTPSEPYVPATIERVVVREGRNGPVATDGGELAAEISNTFTVARGSVERVQQMLAELDYLPVLFAPAGPGAARARALGALVGEGVTPAAVSRGPETGSFIRRFSDTPSQLLAAFVPGQVTPATTGAVMAFEAAHHLPVDGEIGPQVWAALFTAVADRQVDAAPYDYLIVTETQPETLYVWQDGKIIYQSAANTGVYGAETELGTFPVYLRFVSATMTGKNPDGTTYDDPGVPYIAYFNGSDAVHGFIRAEYGFPQSDGCVELPVPNAAYVFQTDPLGTLVTVTVGALSPELHAQAPSYYPSTAPSASPPSSTTTTEPAGTTTVPPTTTPPRRHRRRRVPTTGAPTTAPPTTAAPGTVTTTTEPVATTTAPAG